MSSPRVVRSANGSRLYVREPDGGLGLPHRAELGRKLALLRGIPPEEIDRAETATTVVADPLQARSQFDSSTSTVVEEADRLDRLELLSTAWHLRQLLEDPVNRHFDYLVARHDDDIYIREYAAWTVHDDGLYFLGGVPSPGVDADAKRHLRLLSRGRTIVLTRAGKPSRKFVALDLQRTWELAEAFESENPKVMENWRANGPAIWKRLKRRGA